jgi:hypothetical protein
MEDLTNTFDSISYYFGYYFLTFGFLIWIVHIAQIILSNRKYPASGAIFITGTSSGGIGEGKLIIYSD